MTRRRISVFLADQLAERLQLAAKRPGEIRSAIVNAALDRFLGPERDLEASATVTRRLDRVGRQLDRIERDLSIITETVGLHVRYHLSVTPPLAAAEQETARALGRDRFELFVAQLGRRLASGGRLVAEILDRANPSRTQVVQQGEETGTIVADPAQKANEQSAVRDANQLEQLSGARKGLDYV
jgi:predicted DNA-binding protein